MTAVTPYVQPIFDPRMTALSSPLSSSGAITRGFMIWDKAAMAGGGVSAYNQPAVFSFLFNPSTISVSYQLADGSAQAALNYGQAASGNSALLLPLQQQISFSVMFDRTYELNTPSIYQSTPGIQYHGVDVDVAALRQYTGMFADVYAGNEYYYGYTPGSTSSSGKASANTNASQVSTFNSPMGALSQGIMQVTLGYLYFGGTTAGGVAGNTAPPVNGSLGAGNNAAANGGTAANGQPSGQNFGLTYYGYIDSWSVEYTHFTQWMVPIRCVVDMSFTLLPPPSAAPDAAGATKISQSQSRTASNSPTTTPQVGVPGGIGGR